MRFSKRISLIKEWPPRWLRLQLVQKESQILLVERIPQPSTSPNSKRCRRYLFIWPLLPPHLPIYFWAANHEIISESDRICFHFSSSFKHIAASRFGFAWGQARARTNKHGESSSGFEWARLHIWFWSAKTLSNFSVGESNQTVRAVKIRARRRTSGNWSYKRN